MQTISVNDWMISDVEISHETPVFYSESINLKGNAIGTGLHRLIVKFTITTETAADTKRLQALLLNIRGQLSPFELNLGSVDGWFNVLTTPNATAVLNIAPVLQGATSMTLNNTTIPVGSYFQFPNDTKLYMVTASSGSQYNFFPAARFTTAGTSRINFSNPRLRLRMDTNAFSMKMGRAESITLSCKEVL
ncbi:hypothetical protein [Aeromonas rivipollensis]|uniref:hypothetical protein n=1 Tax=Aeromonas rivipollensis TaxID=948519 RepID=UPI0013CF62F8|nr:hypothetical protein [Aeromonas rivipollensis]NEX81742.1 hypothetical protein [Aeromonas rivipollensis]